MNRTLSMTLLTALVLLPSAASLAEDPGECLSDAEAELLNLINQYRADNMLPPVPWSKSLTEVGQWHVWDLFTNHPEDDFNCNLHSWSDQGVWSPVCYTPDHANAAGMWNKPREITAGVYGSNGFEIAVEGTVSPAVALAIWQGSAPHNDVLLNQGIFAGVEWRAIGAGILDQFVVVWFGELADPNGSLVACSQWVFHDGFESGGTSSWSTTVP